jgi:hypothetical protein
MQPQDYLPFFQDLALQTYQTTLELPVYAASLTVIVWLLTAIFYSIRISFIKGHLKRALKAGKEIQLALHEAEQREQVAQEAALQHQAQKEQSDQVSAQLSGRLEELSQQFIQSIHALAANPDLGQQGLTATPGLAPEALWQRLNAASSQIADKLLEERRALSDMQQAVQDEVAKTADKEQQLQAAQLRLESQSQQLAKLSLAQEEHKAELAAQQQASQQQLLALEDRYRREMAALKASKPEPKPEVKLTLSSTPIEPVPAPAPAPAPLTTAAVTPDAFKFATPTSPVADNNSAVELNASTAFRAAPINPLASEASIVPPVITPEPTTLAAPQAVAEPEKPKPSVSGTTAAKAATPSSTQSTAAASSNKLKGFFASAKDTFKKIDQKLGSPSDEPAISVAEEELVVTPAVQAVEDLAGGPVSLPPLTEALASTESAPAVTETLTTLNVPAPEAKKKLQLGGLLNKLKRK